MKKNLSNILNLSERYNRAIQASNDNVVIQSITRYFKLCVSEYNMILTSRFFLLNFFPFKFFFETKKIVLV